MSRNLRVLNIEDSERDVELLRRHLSRAGYDLYFDRVETREGMKAALDAQEWDVILCDYSMPQFNALEALGVLKERGLDIPFIIISGTVGEEVAVTAMRAGAHDYLMKDNLVRLVPTIERERQEAENRRARKQAEEALLAREQRFRSLIENSSDAIALFRPDGAILYASPSTPQVLGFTPEELLLFNAFDMIHPDDRRFVAGRVSAALAAPRVGVSGQARARHKDGSWRWMEGTFTNLLKEPSVGAIVNNYRDITERKRVEEELVRLGAEIESQRQRVNNIVANVPGVVWEAWGQPDAAMQQIDFVSDYVETMLGYSVEEWLRTPGFWLSIIHPEDREWSARAVAASLARGGQATMEFRWIAKDGRALWVESHYAVISDDEGRPVGLRGVTIDISDRKTLEEQLRQSQKMEAIGQLAGGIAHDFNNLLTVITGYSELSIKRLQSDDPLRRSLEEIKKAGDRAASLTRQLLAFSRKQVLQLKFLDLNEVVSDMEKMLRRLIGENIELRTALDQQLGSIKADPGQIEQVIMNLAVNARDAMPGGGKLTIETQNVYVDEQYARKHLAVSPGPYVMVAVSDTGAGMDDQTQKHIFEPFFTTKEVGRGTGLGLSTVYGIVRQSAGNIWVYSEVGRGTTFKIYLPRAEEEAQGYKRSVATEEALRGTETILLAEDEETLRKLAREVLEMYGYQVMESANGGAALLFCERHKGPIHLLLTDVIMPEMSGRELAIRLAGLRPEMKTLYMSGYTDTAIVHQGVLNEGENFIQKPFSPEALAQKVREVLDKSE
jgi:PAS domain S-box-containing protein